MKIPSNMFHRLSVVLVFGALLATAVYAQNQTVTLHLPNGQTLTGEIVQMNDESILLRQPDGQPAPRVPWSKLSQEDLKELEQNPKAAKFVEPFIEATQQDKIKKTEVEIKEDYPKLEGPWALADRRDWCSSVAGFFTLLVLYAANIYAAYEISIFRAQPAGLVCGVAAVAPLIGPIIFLSMPTRLRKKEPQWQQPVEELAAQDEAAAAIAAEQAAAAVQQAAAPRLRRNLPDRRRQRYSPEGNSLSTGDFLRRRCPGCLPWRGRKPSGIR